MYTVKFNGVKDVAVIIHAYIGSLMKVMIYDGLYLGHFTIHNAIIIFVEMQLY